MEGALPPARAGCARMAGGYSSESARRALPPTVYSELGEERGEAREVPREGRLFRIKFTSLALVTVRY